MPSAPSLIGCLAFATIVACGGERKILIYGAEGDPADEVAADPQKGAGTETPGQNPPPPANQTPAAGEAPGLPDGVVENVSPNCNSSGIQGNGQITRTTRSASGFTKVASRISGSVVIQEGTPFRLQVETDSNVQDSITTVVGGDTLDIGTKGTFCMHRLRVLVTMPAFRAALAQGSGNVDIAKKTSGDVDLSLPGSGNLEFTGQARALRVSLAGSGSIHLVDGTAESTSVDLSGSGSVDATNFTPGTVSRAVSGSGNVGF